MSWSENLHFNITEGPVYKINIFVRNVPNPCYGLKNWLVKISGISFRKA